MPVSEEVLESLTDELATTRLRPSLAAVGILALHASVFRKRDFAVPDGGPAFIVNNPVRHGAEFVSAVVRGLESEGMPVFTVTDARLATLPGLCIAHFPGVGVRSMSGWPSLRSLAFAWRTLVASWSNAAPEPSRIVWVYLVLAQAVRYFLAAEFVWRDLSAWSGAFTDFDRGLYAAPWVFAVRRSGLPVATLVHGSPSATYLPVKASHVYVWGEVQQRFFNAAGARRTEVVGRPDWTGHAIDRSELTGIVICHSMEVLTGGESARLQELLLWGRRRGLRSTVRWHPRLRAGTLPDSWAEVAANSVETTASTQPLRDATGPGELIAVVGSTAGVEALCHGRRVVIAADDTRELPCDLAAMRSASVDFWRRIAADEDVAATLTKEIARTTSSILAYRGTAAVRKLKQALERLSLARP